MTNVKQLLEHIQVQQQHIQELTNMNAKAFAQLQKMSDLCKEFAKENKELKRQLADTSVRKRRTVNELAQQRAKRKRAS